MRPPGMSGGRTPSIAPLIIQLIYQRHCAVHKDAGRILHTHHALDTDSAALPRRLWGMLTGLTASQFATGGREQSWGGCACGPPAVNPAQRDKCGSFESGINHAGCSNERLHWRQRSGACWGLCCFCSTVPAFLAKHFDFYRIAPLWPGCQAPAQGSCPAPGSWYGLFCLQRKANPRGDIACTASVQFMHQTEHMMRRIISSQSIAAAPARQTAC